MESNKKSKLGLGILIGILITVIIVLAGYIIYDKMISKDKNQNNIEEKEQHAKQQTTKELNINDDIVIKLFNIVNEEKNNIYNLFETATLEEIIPVITMQNISNSDIKQISCNDLDPYATDEYFCGLTENNEMSNIRMNSSMNKDEYTNAIKQNYTEFVNENIFNIKLREIFGKNATYNKEDFQIFRSNKWHYNTTKNGYALYGCECGGMGNTVKQNIETAILNDDIITLTTSISLDGNATKYSDVIYTFKLETDTGNYIYTNRVEKKVEA